MYSDWATNVVELHNLGAVTKKALSCVLASCASVSDRMWIRVSNYLKFSRGIMLQELGVMLV